MNKIKDSVISRVFLNVLMIVLLLVAVLMNISLFTKNQALAVISGSMEPTLPYGCLIVISPQESYHEGDMVTFRSTGNEEVKRFTHRIVSIDDGYAVTKGDANTSVDPEPSALTRAEGKVLFSIPAVGYLVMAFDHTIVKIISILLVILWLALEIEFIRRRKQKLKMQEEGLKADAIEQNRVSETDNMAQKDITKVEEHTEANITLEEDSVAKNENPLVDENTVEKDNVKES